MLFKASEITEPEEQSNTGNLKDKVVASECDKSGHVAACAETQTNESIETEMEPKEFMENMENSQELTLLKELLKLTLEICYPRMYMYQPIFMRRLESLKTKGEGLEP